jgi:uncharacterized protein YkwD
VVPALLRLQWTARLELFSRVNADRAAHGLRPVAYAPELLETARVRAAAQLKPVQKTGEKAAGRWIGMGLTHDDAVGPLAFQRLLRERQIGFKLAGENLARPHLSSGSGSPAEAAERALMLSATHRENILEPSYDRMAVGVARGADGQVVFAQIFVAGV